MAKSLRSKWRRKCRAVKRERYNVKELDRLKKALNNDPCNKPADVDMAELTDIATVVDKTTMKEKIKSSQVRRSRRISDKNDMEVETAAIKEKERYFNSKTMKDQNGTYPVWMHPRKIHKRKKMGKGKLKKKGGKSKWTAVGVGLFPQALVLFDDFQTLKARKNLINNMTILAVLQRPTNTPIKSAV